MGAALHKTAHTLVHHISSQDAAEKKKKKKEAPWAKQNVQLKKKVCKESDAAHYLCAPRGSALFGIVR